MRSNSIVFSHFEAQLHVAPVRLSRPMLHAVGVGTEAHWVRRNSRCNVLASEAAATDNARVAGGLAATAAECSSAVPAQYDEPSRPHARNGRIRKSLQADL